MHSSKNQGTSSVFSSIQPQKSNVLFGLLITDWILYGCRAKIIFGLNALNGRVPMSDDSLGGPWNYTNAASFIRYTVSKGYDIHGWELGMFVFVSYLRLKNFSLFCNGIILKLL